MFEKFKKLSYTTKGFIILIILVTIGIILRWPTIKEEIKRGFSFFGSNNEPTEQVENSQDSIN